MKAFVIALLAAVGLAAQLLTTGAGALGSAGGGGANTLTLVATSTCTAIGSTANCTITTTGTGHPLVASLMHFTAASAISAVHAGADNFTQVAGAQSTCSGATADIWFLTATGGARTTLTATTASGNAWYASLYELTSTSGTLSVDQVAQPGVSGTNPAGPTIITTFASELLASMDMTSNTASAVATPFTFDFAGGGNGWAHDLAAATGTFTPNWTSSGATQCETIASFKP